METHIRSLPMLLLMLFTLLPYTNAQAQDPLTCSGLPPLPVSSGTAGLYGLDYRIKNSEHQRLLELIKKYHFGPEVQQLISGMSGTISSDLDFALQRFPNHHQVLYTLIRYARRSPEEVEVPPECYLQRAVNMFPDDANVRILFGIHLHNKDDYEGALTQYQVAEKLFSNSAELAYNMGLLYLDMEDYGNAQKYARRAYELGYQLPGLQRKLQAAGYWP